MTSQQLHTLRQHAFSTHPWRQKAIISLLIRIRKELGDTLFCDLKSTLDKAKAQKSPDLWYDRLLKLEKEIHIQNNAYSTNQ